MAKKQLNEVQWIDEMNGRIDAMRNGLTGKVIPSPVGSPPSNAWGYAWSDETEFDANLAMAQAHADMQEEYELVVTRRH